MENCMNSIQINILSQIDRTLLLALIQHRITTIDFDMLQESCQTCHNKNKNFHL